MEDGFWFEFGGLLLLIACSGFFSGSETAMTAVSRARMSTLERGGNLRAGLLNRLLKKKDRMIGALLFGNTLVNILAGSLATSVLIRLFGDAGVVYATITVTILVLIFAEVLPKTYALLHSDRMALAVAPVISVVVAIFAPITHLVAKIVEGIFRIFGVKMHIARDAHEEEIRGAIHLYYKTMAKDDDEEEQEKGAMLRSIMELEDVHVEEIMVHRKNVSMINGDLPVVEVIDQVLHSAFTRLPVWRENPDNIVGVIHTKRLLNEIRRCNGDFSLINLENAMIEPWFVPESITLFDQLQAFRRRREHFSIMVDEYGSLMGVVTLEDILEEIVGEISDEHDTAVVGVREQSDGSYIVDGNVTIRDLNRELDWTLPGEEYSTIAGLLLFESQRIPSVGQSFTYFGFIFEILKKQKNQISSVRIVPIPKEGEIKIEESIAS